VRAAVQINVKKLQFNTLVNGDIRHLKQQKSQKDDITQQHVDIKAMCCGK